MDAYTGYIYSAVWLIIAVYLFFTAIKHSRFFFFLSGFFLYLSGWYLLDEILTDVDMFSGVYNLIFRGVAVVVLIVCTVVYVRYKRDIAERDGENTHK
ncbi:MAG: hypothetical protein IKB73_04520 [Ruminococcus sp.]|nr:hypothetical protein [Ruminococcus sp.]